MVLEIALNFELKNKLAFKELNNLEEKYWTMLKHLIIVEE